MGLLKRAAPAIVAGIPVGMVLYIVADVANNALGTSVISPMVMLAIGIGASVGIHMMADLKEN